MALARYASSGILVLGVFFPGVWFVDLLFERFGGRPVKMFAWAIVMMVASLVAGYSCWLRRRARIEMLLAMVLAFFASAYFTVYQWTSPPVYTNNQALSLCILAPYSLWLGLAAKEEEVAPVLAFLGGSVLLLFIYRMIEGGVSLATDAFQALLPARNNDEAGNTGYQGLSLFAGFLSIFLLSRLAATGTRVFSPLCFLAISIAPVLSIGGRSALVALIFTSFVWLLLNGLRGKRQLCVALLSAMAAVIVIGIGFYYVDQVPLSVKRLLWLLESGEQDDSLRLTLWGSAVRLWLQSPVALLIGHGPQRFPSSAGYGEVGMYPHNFILELLAEYGIFGCALFFSAPIYLFVDAIRNSGSGIRRKPSLYFSVYYFSAMMFMGALQSIWPFFFLVGWMWTESTRQRRPIEPR